MAIYLKNENLSDSVTVIGGHKVVKKHAVAQTKDAANVLKTFYGFIELTADEIAALHAPQNAADAENVKEPAKIVDQSKTEDSTIKVDTSKIDESSELNLKKDESKKSDSKSELDGL